MKTLVYMGRLVGELFGYSVENKSWWLVPLVSVLGVFGLVISVGQVAAPFIYSIF